MHWPKGGTTEFFKRELYKLSTFFSPKRRYRTFKKVPTELQSCLNSHNSKSLILTLAHPEDRRGSSYLRAQRISRRGEDAILTQCPARYETSETETETETPTALTYVRQRCRSTNDGGTMAKGY